MNKIDRRHTYGIMIDTETANTRNDENGRLDTRDALCYDIGFWVIDTHGRQYEDKFSFVNTDIFFHEKEAMTSAYYADKIAKYWEDIKAGTRTLASTYQINCKLREMIEKYDCQFICAHNARFDYNALNSTQRYVTKSKYRYFVPKSLVWYDTLKMARSVLSQMPTYRRFCEENGYITKNNQCRYTAEIIYRYITKDNNFIESHTGLEDVEIEAQIFAYCVRQHKKMEKLLWES